MSLAHTPGNRIKHSADRLYADLLNKLSSTFNPIAYLRLKKLLKKEKLPVDSTLLHQLATQCILHPCLASDRFTLSCVQKLIDTGNPNGHLLLGYIYEYGLCGQDQSGAETLYYKMMVCYRIAADNGLPAAQYAYARYLLKNIDDLHNLDNGSEADTRKLREEAKKQLQTAANKGYEPAKQFVKDYQFSDPNAEEVESSCVSVCSQPQQSYPPLTEADLRRIMQEISALRQDIQESEGKITQTIQNSEDKITQTIQNSEDKILEEIRKEDERIEKLVEELCEKASLFKQKNYSDEDIEESRNELIQKIGKDNWNKKLSPHARDALITARVLMRPGLPDYGWAVVEVMAVLDKELRLRFFEQYQDYLEQQGIEPEDWPDGLRFYNKNGMYVRNQFFGLGSFVKMFVPNKKTGQTILKEFQKVPGCDIFTYLRSKVWHEGNASDENSMPCGFYEFVKSVDELTIIRNQAAHGNPINREAAFGCWSQVLGYTFNDANTLLETTEGILKTFLDWVQ